MDLFSVLVFFVFVAIVVVVFAKRARMPEILEGRVLTKELSEKYGTLVLIQTTGGEKITLQFDTTDVDVSIVIGAENFHGREKELGHAIGLGDVVRVETFSKSGLIRDVSRLLSVSVAREGGLSAKVFP